MLNLLSVYSLDEAREFLAKSFGTFLNLEGTKRKLQVGWVGMCRHGTALGWWEAPVDGVLDLLEHLAWQAGTWSGVTAGTPSAVRGSMLQAAIRGVLTRTRSAACFLLPWQSCMPTLVLTAPRGADCLPAGDRGPGA